MKYHPPSTNDPGAEDPITAMLHTAILKARAAELASSMAALSDEDASDDSASTEGDDGIASAGIADDELEVACFNLGSEQFAIPTMFVREAQPLRHHHWTHVPCAPSFILGAVNLRGRIYSITDLGRFIGLPPRPISDHAYLLLVSAPASSGAAQAVKAVQAVLSPSPSPSHGQGLLELTLLTDELPQVRLLSQARLLPPPDHVSATTRPYILGMANQASIIGQASASAARISDASENTTWISVLDMAHLLNDPRLIVRDRTG